MFVCKRLPISVCVFMQSVTLLFLSIHAVIFQLVIIYSPSPWFTQNSPQPRPALDGSKHHRLEPRHTHTDRSRAQR